MDDSARAAMATAEHVRLALLQPFNIEGQIFNPSASIGVTLMPKPDQSAKDLLGEADTEVYLVKTAGRNRIAVFEADMQIEAEDRLALELYLSRATPKARFSAPKC